MRHSAAVSEVGVGGTSVVSMNMRVAVATFTIIAGLELNHPIPNTTFPPIEFSRINVSDLADCTFNVSCPTDGIVNVNTWSLQFRVNEMVIQL